MFSPGVHGVATEWAVPPTPANVGCATPPLRTTSTVATAGSGKQRSSRKFVWSEKFKLKTFAIFESNPTSWCVAGGPRTRATRPTNSIPVFRMPCQSNAVFGLYLCARCYCSYCSPRLFASQAADDSEAVCQWRKITLIPEENLWCLATKPGRGVRNVFVRRAEGSSGSLIKLYRPVSVLAAAVSNMVWRKSVLFVYILFCRSLYKKY